MVVSFVSEYIKYYLGNFIYGCLFEGYECLDYYGDVVEILQISIWMFVYNGQEVVDMGFMVFYVDFLVWVGGFGIIMCLLFWLVVCKVIVGVFIGFMNFMEFIIEFVDNQVCDIFYGKSKLIVLLLLVIFCWVFLMNLMDLIFVDLFFKFFEWIMVIFFGWDVYQVYFKIVFIIDFNIILVMFFLVMLLIIGFMVKVKGFGGFVGELVFKLFEMDNIVLKLFFLLVNLVLEIISLLFKLVFLGLWFFGNMYVGEFVFILVVVMMGIWQFIGVWLWVVFYILVIIFQVFIFMVLIIVYLSMVVEEY